VDGLPIDVPEYKLPPFWADCARWRPHGAAQIRRGFAVDMASYGRAEIFALQLRAGRYQIEDEDDDECEDEDDNSTYVTNLSYA
jgi:hypothetical protein